MNKGVVVELNNDIAVIMSEDGRFLKVKAFAGLYQGMEMVYSDMDIVRTKKTEKKVKFGFTSRFSQVAAAVIVGFALLSGSYVYYDYSLAVYASITLDVNPSMQLDIGKRSQVIKVEELNNDAEKLLDGLNLNGQPVADAISEVENRLQEKGYFKTDKENYMLLGYMNVNGKMDMKDLKTKVEDSAIKKATAANIDLQVKSVNTNVKLVSQTKKTNDKVSAGRQTYVTILKNEGVIDKNTDASTAKIPALFESQNKMISSDLSSVTTVTTVSTATSTQGSATVTVTVTEGATATLTPSTTPTGGVITKDGDKNSITVTPGDKTSNSLPGDDNSTTTITITGTDVITPTPTGTELGDKTIDNNKYTGKQKLDVTVTLTPTPTPTLTITITPDPVSTGTRSTESIDVNDATTETQVPEMPAATPTPVIEPSIEPTVFPE